MTMASIGLTVSSVRDRAPARSSPVLVTKTPPVGRLGDQLGSRAWGSEPKLNRTRKCTQPQERRKARRPGGGEGEAGVEELVEEEEELLKGRKVKLPKRSTSSRERE